MTWFISTLHWRTQQFESRPLTWTNEELGNRPHKFRTRLHRRINRKIYDWIFGLIPLYGMSWPNGQGIGLAVVWSPVRTLPPRDNGGALCGVAWMPFQTLVVEYINKWDFYCGTCGGLCNHGVQSFLYCGIVDLLRGQGDTSKFSFQHRCGNLWIRSKRKWSVDSL